MGRNTLLRGRQRVKYCKNSLATTAAAAMEAAATTQQQQRKHGKNKKTGVERERADMTTFPP